MDLRSLLLSSGLGAVRLREPTGQAGEPAIVRIASQAEHGAVPVTLGKTTAKG
ncbi:hypothetical protein PEC18_22430 [Paucibacter sp. O1-1]|uniref:hypothetical protein n=1 Tax=unclassified Roseateles TaxID=2626991 RepID=UPI0021D4BDBF|nr:MULTISPECIES: hypothetical protein [unclassified Roseateles]MCU7373503.1 hypothetical protein [Paucibacter sp. O1-1]MCZ7879798.1 hypothetical protein [Paucibacter sp. M5-1]MDA3828503.1 hypothetical protein [Paucibacter sp. O1-1]